MLLYITVMRFGCLLGLLVIALRGEEVTLSGIQRPVEILRDRWGVPHIYAQEQTDLFFAQGYMAARDRLFQIDLWRRIGTGRLSEVLGASALDRDRLARQVRYRGDWSAEWNSYGPDTRAIARAFTSGINAYIRSLNGRRPAEFRLAGYDPALWAPEDVTARIAGLLMTRNLTREVQRSLDARYLGLATLQKYLPPDPPIALEVPGGLNLDDITGDILRVYNQAIGPVRLSEQGSNNWVVDGSMTSTGKPILANDPHRSVQIPSLRKTVHLVGPGWNAFGAGEPALPGIALGHNEEIAFGFTIVGIDQQDLYIEKLNPENPNQYRYRGAWRDFETERQQFQVKGESSPRTLELRYTVHGPVLHEDAVRRRAYALKWVGTEPGSAGYLAGLGFARARNWSEFLQAVRRYRVPSENVVYADRAGNIGWQATGLTPIRKGWSGLFPVPGDSGEYEWSGFLDPDQLPREYNPQSHFIATANHNILPPGYKHVLGYEWAAPFRVNRVREMLTTGKKFSVEDFQRMQQDVTSIPARRFVEVVRRWKPRPGSRAAHIRQKLINWDAALTANSTAAMLYEVWIAKLPPIVFGPRLGARTDLSLLLSTLEAKPNPQALEQALDEALSELERILGPDMNQWNWGRIHQIHFRHPLNEREFNRGPVARPGDAHTVNNTSGSGFRQTNGASWRQVVDVSDWDKSVMTNVPGESGDPSSPHYSDLIDEWASGRYHPMLYSRKAVESATVEKIVLKPR